MSKLVRQRDHLFAVAVDQREFQDMEAEDRGLDGEGDGLQTIGGGGGHLGHTSIPHSPQLRIHKSRAGRHKSKPSPNLTLLVLAACHQAGAGSLCGASPPRSKRGAIAMPECYTVQQAQTLLERFIEVNGKPPETIEELAAWIDSWEGQIKLAAWRDKDGNILPTWH